MPGNPSPSDLYRDLPKGTIVRDRKGVRFQLVESMEGEWAPRFVRLRSDGIPDRRFADRGGHLSRDYWTLEVTLPSKDDT